MSVQCKNCANGIPIKTEIMCTAWVNRGCVNGKKQRLCERYLDRKKILKRLEDN